MAGNLGRVHDFTGNSFAGDHFKNKAAMEEKIFTIFLPANKRVYQVMAVVAAFCVVLYFFGFYIGALLFIPIVMYIMEARRPKKIIITTVATVAGIYVVFAILLKISLPAPFFYAIGGKTMGDILTALSSVFVPVNILGLVFGTGVGILIGALPGLSVNMGIALLFPLTFSFQGVGGILMLLGIYCGAIYGGSISAILLRTPGTPASVATTLDGYPMATKLGQPGRALGLSTMGSAFGGIFSAICLIILSPLLARVALQFSKPEYFALAVFGISIITSVSSGSIIKGLLGGVIGLFIATIGIDNLSGNLRFTFGTTYLLGDFVCTGSDWSVRFFAGASRVWRMHIKNHMKNMT